MRKPLPRRQKGDVITADMWNELVDAINPLLLMQVSAPLGMTNVGAGISLRLLGALGNQIAIGKINDGESLDRGSLSSPTTCKWTRWVLKDNATGEFEAKSQDNDLDLFDVGFLNSDEAPLEGPAQIFAVKLFGLWFYFGHDCSDEGGG